MSILRLSRWWNPKPGTAWVLVLVLIAGGCARIAGNYPPPERLMACVSAQLTGEGFQILAGSRMPLDRVDAELDQLKSQGFSRHDPQIIKSVARRNNIPPALLTDRSGCDYYRFTALLEAGSNLTLAPGALKVTLQTGDGFIVVHDQGYLLEDRRWPGGCRPPDQAALTLGPHDRINPVTQDFLVRLPARGKIVGLGLVPDLGGFARGSPPP